MAQYSRILVGLGLSKASREALEYAVALSARHGAELVAVQAVPPDQPFSRNAGARLALSERLRERAARAQITFTERVQTGDPAEIILLHARSLQPDVVVVGTHQRRGFERLQKGSVAERVAATATVPVWLVPQGRRASTTRPRHLAVAVDFGTASTRAVEHALALATVPGDRITLMHVVPGFSSPVRPYVYGFGVVTLQEDAMREAGQQLFSAVPAGRTEAIVQTQVVTGDAPIEINRLIDQIGADLLLVGVPHRGAVSRALLGTTSMRLLRTVRVPMVAVPDHRRVAAHEPRATVRIAA